MPNAFTPNGDGKNDVFGLTNAKFQKLLRFEIYNRWGQQVFSTIDPLKGWDGTFEGKNCDQAVYNYIIVVELPNKTIKTYNGTVTLFR
jgi:gliding motility-associated-like protein